MNKLIEKAKKIAEKKALLALINDEPWAIRHFLGDLDISMSSSMIKNIKFDVKVMGEDSSVDENDSEE